MIISLQLITLAILSAAASGVMPSELRSAYVVYEVGLVARVAVRLARRPALSKEMRGSNTCDAAGS